MSKEEIEQRIVALKEEHQNVKGTECECYQRIVGYYRNVKRWNAGKAEEYIHRKLFVAPSD
jgi:anaerobic ribonucleoside-triphosphate reductase